MTADASTRSQLLRAVLDEPFEDTVRLVYADELEENGERERAEFIRVQCELAQLGCGEVDPELLKRTDRVGALAQRQRELWRSPPAGEWFGDDVFLALGRSVFDRTGEVGKPSGLIRRGFVTEIRLPAAAFLEHAAAMFAAHPITKVVLTGVTPWHQYFNGAKPTLATYAVGGRFDDSQSVIPEVLDPFVCELVTDIHTHRVVSGVWWTFKNDAHTLDILSRACVNYGRSLVGLRPLYART